MGLFTTRLAHYRRWTYTIYHIDLCASNSASGNTTSCTRSAVVPVGTQRCQRSSNNIPRQKREPSDRGYFAGHEKSRATMPKVVDATCRKTLLRGVKVGSTWYDFQTNHSMPNRLAYFEDGPDKYLQVLWMAAKDGTRDPVTTNPWIQYITWISLQLCRHERPGECAVSWH